MMTSCNINLQPLFSFINLVENRSVQWNIGYQSALYAYYRGLTQESAINYTPFLTELLHILHIKLGTVQYTRSTPESTYQPDYKVSLATTATWVSILKNTQLTSSLIADSEITSMYVVALVLKFHLLFALLEHIRFIRTNCNIASLQSMQTQRRYDIREMQEVLDAPHSLLSPGQSSTELQH